ncbi:PorT family protein [Flaviaesturariibacter flavus]|uniref:PorT family protein n=1 Tax=Flaviaesturariibacter flavus TaxID=2502780 RepID=A0A4R1BA47_9BACT|nr:outer membrane beta-barrel protein [Flaviaesturariibacter flavus]TCJ13794.1 PorT family protein [Flaviaesturariibacter flavus]
MRKKPLIIAALAVATAGTASAQQLRAGINLANVSNTANGRVDKANMLSSFQVGLLGDVKLGTKIVSLQSGLLFTGKGSKVQRGEPGQLNYYKQTVNPHYIELPVNVIVRPPIGLGARLFVGAGPYAAVGVGGKVNTESSSLISSNSSRKIRFSNDDPTTLNQEEGTGFGVMRRFDYGLNGTIGLETKFVVIGANYGLGLAKLQSGSNSSADNANKHRVLSFFVGVKLP